jgi:hypothetical protein
MMSDMWVIRTEGLAGVAEVHIAVFAGGPKIFIF